MRFMEITVAASSKQIYRKLAAKTMIMIASSKSNCKVLHFAPAAACLSADGSIEEDLKGRKMRMSSGN